MTVSEWYELSVLIQGFPGASSTNGGFGWSTVALLSKGQQHILIDGGGFGARSLLLRRLNEKGLVPEQITAVLITHAHWDHAVNWPMFPDAELIAGRIELDWALGLTPGHPDVPLYEIRKLSQSPRLRLLEHGDEALPGITAHLVPGHTPGQLAFVANQGGTDLVFGADAAKTRTELVSREVGLTLDEAASKQSIAYLWELWTRKPGSLLVPGHDLPMKLENGHPVYAVKRDVDIRAWFGTGPDDWTRLSPSGDSSTVK